MLTVCINLSILHKNEYLMQETRKIYLKVYQYVSKNTPVVNKSIKRF